MNRISLNFLIAALLWSVIRMAAATDPAAASAGTMISPGAAWVEATPVSQQMDSAKLRDAVAFLKANSGRDGARELVIIRNGRLIWKGDNIDHVHGIWSCTKSFTSTVLGLLIAGGKCSLDTRVAGILPELQTHYGDVTLRQFTTMTSGYRAEGDETDGGYTHGPSATPFKPNASPLFAPGLAYAYWDSAMNELALALTRLAGEPLDTYFKRRIADPIGMNAGAWKWGHFGEVDGLRINGGSGNHGRHVEISAREMARLGHLFLNEGQWNGRQLIPADWVRTATAVQVAETVANAWPRSGIGGPGHYGFNWWRNGAGTNGKLMWPGAPGDTFAALGHNNNKLIVIPEWKIVIVRLGLDEGEKKVTDEAIGGFLAMIGNARMAADTAPLVAPGLTEITAMERSRILKAAEVAMGKEPVSITKFRTKLSEGGPNDFYSNGDYWWPDPAKPDGLPYVQRDGQSNPDNFSQHRLALRELRDAVAALGAAYKVTGEDRYAAKAAELLRVFFLDSKTRMTPHLNYAQAIPGVSPGRGIGIIDALHLIEVPPAIEAMATSPAFSPELLAGLRKWFGDLAEWMVTSKNGQDEAKTTNNHAVAYFLQLAVYAQFSGDAAKVAECRRQCKEVFIPKQMAPDGSFPRELARTKPYGYSIFQLDNMATLCQVLSTPEENLWNDTLPDGRGIHKAMEFLFP